MNAQTILGVLVAVLPLFVHDPTEQAEIIGFLSALSPVLGGAKSGTIPQFKAGPLWIGPIPFTETPPTA